MKELSGLKEGLSDDGRTFIVNNPYRMFSGQADAAQFVYRKVPCKTAGGACWLYPVNSETPGENVYFHDPADTKSQGFGGATLKFVLEDGTVYAAKGPWHGSADQMFTETGVDLRDTHRTYGVVARVRKALPQKSGNGSHWLFEDVIHGDCEPQIGRFSRIHDLVQHHANELGVPVAYYSQSKGGSSCGWVLPQENGKAPKEWRKWDEYIRAHS